MSYSFSVKAETKEAAIAAVADELDKVVSSQPVHEADRAQALAAADAFIALIRDDDTQDILVNVNGSVWSVEDGLNSASVGVSAALCRRETATAD